MDELLGAVRQMTSKLDDMGAKLDSLTTDVNEVAKRLLVSPSFEELPTFDVHHVARPRDTLVQQGFAFTENVRWWGARRALSERRQERRQQYSALADFWAGVPYSASAAQADLSGGGCVLEGLGRGQPSAQPAWPPSRPLLSRPLLRRPRLSRPRSARWSL